MEKNLRLFNKKYDCIFSMGSTCHSAELLTKARLRIFSSPFDWLCGGTLQERTELLCNDFEDFLNFEDLEKTGEREYPEKTDIYKNNHNGIIFNHDFPKGIELTQSYNQVKAKYDKRINRLKTKLKTSQNSLIIYMEPAYSEIKHEELIQLTEKVNKIYRNTDLLYIKHNPKMKDKEYTISQLSDNYYIAQLYNKRHGNDDLGNYKNCKLILNKIKRNKCINELFLRIYKSGTRIRGYLFGIKIFSFSIK